MTVSEPRTFAPAEGSTIQTNMTGKIRVNGQALTELVASFFRHNGMPATDALISANGLVLADYVGHESHGVSNNLAGFYLPGLENGDINVTPNIRIIHESPSTATWEADRGMGFVVGHRAMSDVLERAAKVGSGFAAVGNSRHYGMAQVYSRMALERDMIGFSLTNGVTPGVVPFGGLEPKLGTNPISVAVPCGEEPPFVLDMATSTSAFGKIQNYQRDGKTIPPTWALDREGHPTTDPDEAMAAVKLADLRWHARRARPTRATASASGSTSSAAPCRAGASRPSRARRRTSITSSGPGAWTRSCRSSDTRHSWMSGCATCGRRRQRPALAA